MASKNALSDAKKNTESSQQSSNAAFTGQQDSSRVKSNEQYNAANERGQDIYGRSSQLASTGSLAPAAQATASTMQGLGGPAGPAQQHAGNLASTGGVDMGALRSTIPGYQGIQSGPETQNYQEMMHSGGLNDADKSNYLGNGVYKNFSETGGFSDADKNRYMQQATATVPAMYQQMANEMQRRRSVQGGYSPGFNNSMGLLARQGSQEMANTTMNAQNSLLQNVNANKLSGARGLETGQGAFSSLQTGNRLAATKGSVDTQMGALDAQTKAEQAAQAMRQQGMIAGTGLETSQGNTAAENQRLVAGTQNANMIGGLDTMKDLYGTNVSSGINYGNQNLSGISGQAGANVNYGSNLNDNAKATPGLMDEISGGVGMAGGLITGLSPLMGGKKAAA